MIDKTEQNRKILQGYTDVIQEFLKVLKEQFPSEVGVALSASCHSSGGDDVWASKFIEEDSEFYAALENLKNQLNSHAEEIQHLINLRSVIAYVHSN